MEVGSAANSSSVITNALSSQQGSELGKDDFLNLLVAQLANQDPLDPMDNQDFIAQMAQFSALEQQTNLNGNFEKFLSGNMISQYSSLVGKEVTAVNNTAEEDLKGLVTKLTFEEGKTYITVNNEKVPVENIKEIKLSNSN
ncbi:flagellar hook capping protein [bacterium]|nr:flagellar hook capping protein [bacterium]